MVSWLFGVDVVVRLVVGLCTSMESGISAGAAHRDAGADSSVDSLAGVGVIAVAAGGGSLQKSSP